MRAQDITKLAAALAAGDITAGAIKEQLGDGVLESVLAFGGRDNWRCGGWWISQCWH
jgi:hypothetical protein